MISKSCSRCTNNGSLILSKRSKKMSTAVRFFVIPGFEKYSINKKFQVKNNVTEKILKQFLVNGYPSVSLRIDGKNKNYLVHRLMSMTFLGAVGEFTVNHISGIRTDSSLKNIEVCSFIENQSLPKHKKNVGVYPCNNGSGKWRAILCKDREKVLLGYFVERSEAETCYRDAFKDAWGIYRGEPISVELLRKKAA